MLNNTKNLNGNTNDSSITLGEIAELMAEELEGIEVYKALIARCKDPKALGILNAIMADEKKHAKALLNIINEHAQSMLG